MNFRAIAGLFARLLKNGAGQRGPAGLGNAVNVLRFLISGKRGGQTAVTVRLGSNGRSHCWRMIDRNDLTVLDEVFLQQEYAVDVSDARTVVDLGANFGAASVYFAMRWPPARIIAVEPNPAVFERLVGNTSEYPNIHCLPYAIGAGDGTARLHISDSHVASSLMRQQDGGQEIEVPVRSLRSIMRECDIDHIDVLKFDVEGAEDLLFQNPSILKHVRCLIGEVHPDLMETDSETFLKRFSGFSTSRTPLAHGRFMLTGRTTKA